METSYRNSSLTPTSTSPWRLWPFSSGSPRRAPLPPLPVSYWRRMTTCTSHFPPWWGWWRTATTQTWCLEGPCVGSGHKGYQFILEYCLNSPVLQGPHLQVVVSCPHVPWRSVPRLSIRYWICPGGRGRKKAVQVSLRNTNMIVFPHIFKDKKMKIKLIHTVRASLETPIIHLEDVYITGLFSFQSFWVCSGIVRENAGLKLEDDLGFSHIPHKVTILVCWTNSPPSWLAVWPIKRCQHTGWDTSLTASCILI